MPQKRKRDVVTPTWLAETLDPFMAAGGQSWLRYDHCSNVKKARKDKDLIVAAIPWIIKLQGATTMKKTVVEECMGIVVEKYRKKWNLKAADAPD